MKRLKQILKDWFTKEWWEDWFLFILIRFVMPIFMIFWIGVLIWTIYCACTGQPVPNVEHIPTPVMIGNDLFIL